MTDSYYSTEISTTVRLGSKLYRITKRKGVPYVTHKRKTRVLYRNPVGGAYINLQGSRVYFQ